MTEPVDDRCPSCQAEGFEFSHHQAHGERWRVLRCHACELEYWTPRKMRPDFYANAHHGTYERRRQGEAFLRERHFLFLRRSQPGRLFDIGCGEGAFLLEARARGFEVFGLDLDPGNIATAHRRGIVTAVCSQFLDDRGERAEELAKLGSFDWVTAFEVLEHQPEPLRFLQVAASLLASGGHLCGSVPNRDRLLAARKRKQGEGDWPPHHFLWFSRESLEIMLRNAGFTKIAVMPVPEPDLMSQAASFEAALLGPLRRSSRRSDARAQPSSEQSSWARPQRKLLRHVSSLKNLPFIPLALLVRDVLPHRGRQLYFEAST